MQTNPTPEIEPSELDAVRHFLTSGREQTRAVPARGPRTPLIRDGVPIRLGIARARTRGQRASNPSA